MARAGAFTSGGGSAEGPSSALTAAVAQGVLDAELAALLSLLARHRVPLVVASRSPVSARQLREALIEAPGGVLVADSLAEVVLLSGSPSGALPDELREMGVVVIVGEVEGRPRVMAAHYIRRLERDAGGHVQRRPPAVLAAWNEREGRWEHFAWGIAQELADHAGLSLREFEGERAARAAHLAHLGHAR